MIENHAKKLNIVVLQKYMIVLPSFTGYALFIY